MTDDHIERKVYCFRLAPDWGVIGRLVQMLNLALWFDRNFAKNERPSRAAIEVCSFNICPAHPKLGLDDDGHSLVCTSN
jgi:hypothetical protein